MQKQTVNASALVDGTEYNLPAKSAAQPVFSHTASYDLSVVIPTRNERDNIQPLLLAIEDALRGISVEVIFVDDSDDDTPLIISNHAQAMNSALLHIRTQHRLPGSERHGGLATAVEQGMKLARAKYVAVIDADLQHPPIQLRVLYEQAITEDADMVLATRYRRGGSYEGLDGVGRLLISQGFKWTAKLLFPEKLLGISDPLGGFFLFRRSLLDNVTLRPVGYKILLEILIRCSWRKIIEVPYHFHARSNGQSKADMRQGLMALQHMGRLLREEPAAGRVWKVAGATTTSFVGLALLCTLAAFTPRLSSSSGTRRIAK